MPAQPIGANALGSWLPTLTVNGNNNRAGLTPTSGDGLATALRGWVPTICARDFKGQGMSVARRGARKPDNLCSWAKALTGSGSLNPAFGEWFMGFPVGHTELGASAMPSSRRSSR